MGGSQKDMDTASKIMDWSTLAAGLIIAILAIMRMVRVESQRSGKNLIYHVATIMIFLGIPVSNILRNKSWQY